MTPRVLLVGTADTKADELLFLKSCIEEQGGRALVMDVGVLGQPPFVPDFSNADVASAAGRTLAQVAALGDENEAMKVMARGAVALALQAHDGGVLHGVLALGGTMGTDLALDVTAALPLGMPKFVISTVAYSHLIPPERLAPDLMMILWAGGLYGLNGVCKASLSQAAGAVLGACRGVRVPEPQRPRVAISSLGKSCLSYMVRLAPALRARGYEPVVFHCTGMGGRAMEALAAQGAFVAVLDLCQQELANAMQGSVVHSGPDRLRGAVAAGVPLMVAPGASDMVDVQSWAELPARYAGRPYHAHNRLLASVAANAAEKRVLAQAMGERLRAAHAPTALLLPRRGIHAWDLPGEPMYDPDGHRDFMDAIRDAAPPQVDLHELDLHINEAAFSDAVLAIFDRWVASGAVPPGLQAEPQGMALSS